MVMCFIVILTKQTRFNLVTGWLLVRYLSSAKELVSIKCPTCVLLMDEGGGVLMVEVF